MPKLRAILLFFACLLGLAGGARAAEEPARFHIESEENSLSVDLNTGNITYTNGVVVRYGTAVLSARRARFRSVTLCHRRATASAKGAAAGRSRGGMQLARTACRDKRP